MKKPFIFALLIIWALPVFAQVETAWVKRYNGPGNDRDWATAIAVDDSSNVYVTGFSWGGWGRKEDYATIKYDASGNQLWVRRYNGPGNSYDWANAIAVDDSGNVYVTGWSFGADAYGDYATIKYCPNGDTAWVRRYNGPRNKYDEGTAIAVDVSGEVYVTGESVGKGTSIDYATIKYYPTGDTAWVRRYEPGGEDRAQAITVDGSSNVYVTGSSGTIKYDSDGNELWIGSWGGADIALDSFNNAYVTGSSGTIKYDSDGNELWIGSWGGVDIALDSFNNVYVTGAGSDFTTIKYYPNGDTAWVRRYNGSANGYNETHAIAVDGSNNAYVTGVSPGVGEYTDYVTIKYYHNGDTAWLRRYNGPINFWDWATAIAVDDSGNVYVTGWSIATETWMDYLTIKYVQESQPPTFTVGIFQNPIFSAELNVYTIASESLKTFPTIIIGADTLAVTQIDYEGTTIYSSNYKLTIAGTIHINVVGTDWNGNVGFHTETFAAGSITPSGGCLVSHDNVLRLEVGAGAVDKEEYFLVFIAGNQGRNNHEMISDLERDGLNCSNTYWDQADGNIISTAYSITPSRLRLKSKAKLSISYAGTDLEGIDLTRLKIHRLDGDVWRTIPTYLDSDKRLVVAFIDELGVYQLRYGDPQSLGMVPTTYVLENNYPNPFNSSTNISYQISSPGWVTVEIHNLLGQKVKILVSQYKPVGRHTAEWNGMNEQNETVSTGIYFYTLKINDFIQTKRMILLK